MSRYIPTIIPYMGEKKIGAAYNREMEKLDEDGWAILMDFDAMIMNPNWQEICERAIDKYESTAGLFTCFTNRIRQEHQIAPGVDTENFDMEYHRAIARSLWRKRRGAIRDHTKTRGCRFSGFFMLTSKTVWRRVGGFKTDSFFHVDVDYYDKVVQKGFRTFLIEDLYCFHMYKREVLEPYFTEVDVPDGTTNSHPHTPKEMRV